MEEELNLHIIACLPFVEISESAVKIGPFTFWSASKYKKYLDKDVTEEEFLHYIRYLGEFKVITLQPENRKLLESFRNTITIDQMTCISIDEISHFFMDNSKINQMLFDAVHLLYFASLFHGLRIQYFHRLNPYLVIKQAEKDFIKTKPTLGWNNVENARYPSERTNLNDKQLLEGLSKLLTIKYNDVNTGYSERIIRAITYFCRRFIDTDIASGLKEYGAQPEDIVFLATSFESLFGTDDKIKEIITEKLCSKLLQSFNLNDDYPQGLSTPDVILTKWVDGFYKLRSKIVHGKSYEPEYFTANPSYTISYMVLGMKVFLIALYYELIGMGLVEGSIFDGTMKKDFLHFLWDQGSLLHVIERYLEEVNKNDDVLIFRKYIPKIHMLEHEYVEAFANKYEHESGYKIHKLEKKKLNDLLSKIRDLGAKVIKIENDVHSIHDWVDVTDFAALFPQTKTTKQTHMS